MPGQQGQCCLNCQSGFTRATGEVPERYWRGTGEVLERYWRGSGVLERFWRVVFRMFWGGLVRHHKHLVENDNASIMNTSLDRWPLGLAPVCLDAGLGGLWAKFCAGIYL